MALGSLANLHRLQAATPKLWACTSGRWRSGKRPLASTTPTWRSLSMPRAGNGRANPVFRGSGALPARAGDQCEGLRRAPSRAARLLDNLAGLYRNQNKYPEAEEIVPALTGDHREVARRQPSARGRYARQSGNSAQPHRRHRDKRWPIRGRRLRASSPTPPRKPKVASAGMRPAACSNAAPAISGTTSSI